MSTNESAARCPRCGVALAADAPEGLCPRCLVALSLGTQTEMPDGGAGPAAASVEPAPGPAPAPAEIAPFFPQLEVIECLGRGGMGAVYKARQPRLDRFVALKILLHRPGAGAQEGAFEERFSREARALAKLNHPDIVAVYDYGEAGGYPFLIMEYVDGLTLRQLLRNGKLPPEEALAIVPKICEALQYAHQQGIVHRDIKPENILLDRQGRVKIADFGIAKLLGPVASENLTQDRQVIGTPQYMAPEQIERPAKVDHRADIYSLGVVFYEMLTGELPLGRFQPPSRKVAVDVRLDQVVLHALDKEPERRYQHASQVKRDVETIAEAPAPSALGSPAGLSPATAAAQLQVRGPAAGLLITGILCWITVPVIVAALWLAPRMGARIATEIATGTGFVAPVAALLFSVLMIVGALRMRRLEAYGLAKTAAILAIIVSPGNLVGLPIGIWALIVLARPDVRAAFRARFSGSAPGSAVRDGSTAATAETVPVRGRWNWGEVLLSLAVQVAAALPLWFFMVFLMPRFVEIYKDMGVALPPVVVSAIRAVRFLGDSREWLIPLMLGVSLLVGLLVRRIDRRLLWTWAVLVVLGVAAFTVMVFTSANLPVTSLTRHLAPHTPGNDRVVVEDLSLRLLAAMRDSEDDVLRSLAADEVKGWGDALPQFAFEIRERSRQATGRPLDLRATETRLDGRFAVVKCTAPDDPNGTCLVLYFVKTDRGWKNWMLRNSPPAIPLERYAKERPPVGR